VYMQDEQVFFEENKELKCDLKALLTLTMGMPLSTDAECDCIINMPLEFIRAVKKSGDNKLIINMLEENKIPEDATVVAIAENILGIDITGKKGIKSSADTESFENIDAEIHTPKGLVAVSVKNKVIEKNTLSVNINQADGEL